ncbi:polysaccharide lyase family 8 super-sandwich domain-containing protein [Aquimarina aggregata]|uniref:polysaccharide lyase family 8 super-sandwich domain-containing protein n=1 Tax=Aquimarina aggregata TaxID=1642818 RepID=UPI002490D38D|nr:polysaccharide lyase family 8 super-sandwich domain-containing protein [Aquimarina aggregata]
MKTILLSITSIFFFYTLNAQLTTNFNMWEALGNTELTLVNDDIGNGDGVADGAWFVDGQDTNASQGAQYIFDGTMTDGEVINIETYLYNTNTSFVRLIVELYNVNDNTTLVTSGTVGFPANNTLPKLVSLNYTTTSSDIGDTLALRYLRVSDFSTFRDFKIDNVKLNGEFIPFLPSEIVSGLNIKGDWAVIGDTEVAVVNNDDDNGDGVGDGALLVNGQSTEEIQGVQYILGGKVNEDETITVNTYVYNVKNTFVRINVELYNLDDQKVLSTVFVGLPSNNLTPKLASIIYPVTNEDIGDRIAVRYMRTSVFDKVRDFNIDNLNFNGDFVSMELPLTGPGTLCFNSLTPDLPIIPSDDTIELEIQNTFNSFSDLYLKTPPADDKLQDAISAYEALNIKLVDNEITGNPIKSFTDAAFLRVFARQLKFNPNDTATAKKANNTVRWVSTQFCQGVLKLNPQMYQYEDFARPTILMRDFLNKEVRDLFSFNLIAHFTNNGNHYWEPNYDATFQENNDAINTDLVHNLGDVLMAYATWQETPDEKYRYMRAFKRFMDRFFSYSYGTANGIKKDGSGYHHWTAYDHYMYTYGSASEIIYHLNKTTFQVEKESYLRFREAIYAQFVTSTSDGNKPLSMSGRIISNRTNSLSERLGQIKKAAIAGGTILGISTPDPVLAGLYNQRVELPDPDFDFTEATTLKEMSGFYQFNHANLAAYRKDDWLIVGKGFTNYTWGTEIYATQNRYGRYQSYGALEILYPGDEKTGLGWDLDTWNWNYNPGTTSLVLPWDKLQAERSRLDERQGKRFAGSLGLSNKNSELLNRTHTDYGMFAMDFQELEGEGFGTVLSSNNHNGTFSFKKSAFMLDDMIVVLGSNIYNNDSINKTVTTLYQRLDNKNNYVLVDGKPGANLVLDESSNHWVVSNYNTNFYIVSGSGNLTTWNGDQKTPNHNQTNPSDYVNNPVERYHIGYLDHGTNPQNSGYEYIVFPGKNQKLTTAFNDGFKKIKKPYIVHQKDSIAHILEYKMKNIWGHAFFTAVDSIQSNSLIASVDSSSLIMYKIMGANKKNDQELKLNKKLVKKVTPKRIRLAIVNPDLGFKWREYTPSVEKVITVQLKGNWALEDSNPEVIVLDASNNLTTISFKTKDGLPIEIVLKNEYQSVKEEIKNPDISKDHKTLVYPNPAFNRIYINFADRDHSLPYSIELLDLKGKILSKKENIRKEGVSFEIINYPPGLYVVKVYLKDKNIESHKIFKR